MKETKVKTAIKPQFNMFEISAKANAQPNPDHVKRSNTEYAPVGVPPLRLISAKILSQQYYWPGLKI